MSDAEKKSRKKTHNYNFTGLNDQPVTVDLNNYTAVCSVTKKIKQFHHAYLANLIATKYDNNIETFELNYVSRDGLAEKNTHLKHLKLEDRISALYTKIRALKIARDELALTS
tara:strand:- start:570 stop:908 length:339 start_codon:yes stop_codon:yes gene_type:complete